METKKELTGRAIIDKKYEEAHKDERKAANIVWGTSIPRELADEINLYLRDGGYTKVELVVAGFDALCEKGPKPETPEKREKRERHERRLSLQEAKVYHGYDDFFGCELAQFEKDRQK
ncbi:MAG: hypothetical protein RSB10_02440 [Clostridia bacterium]